MSESALTHRAAAGLGAGDFAEFYAAVHGHDPFPWQQELVEQVLAEGRWPDLVDVPTGLGKTSMLDVAVFVAAATAGVPGAGRLGRRRCLFVVDRRIVVDEAYEHARRIAESITGAGPGILDRVRAALRSLAPFAGGEVLSVTRMRGGTTWSSAWLDRPDRPGIVLGTVDQVGSRLLFRGYGVSPRRASIDAALVGTDALLLVDEAHLSRALLTTVRAAQQRDRLGVAVPGLSVVQLSATGSSVGRRFTLDVDAHRGNQEAWRRLTAAKSLTCVEAKDPVKAMAEAALGRLAELAADPAGTQAPTALVVCNTVDRARAVHALVGKLLAARNASVEGDCDLLIGRSRLIDRPPVQQRVVARFGTGRQAGARAAVLVATQTVEVGVNLDVDVLVTESASWDALVQRLGRLNRLGRFTQRFPAHAAAPAVVVHDGQDNGPVYGAARDATWAVLARLAPPGGARSVEVSPLQCRDLTATELAGDDVVREASQAPILLGPTLDAWAQTGPIPQNDPPIQPFLHGFDSGAAGVQVAWRSGLMTDDPFDETGSDQEAAGVGALLAALPVRTAEFAEVPFMAVRQWMLGQTPGPVSDLEASPDVEGRTRRDGDPFQVLAWRTADAGVDARSGAAGVWRWIDDRQLRPGDRIVAPCEKGGLDQYGWAPGESAPVSDVAEAATFLPSRSRRPATLVLDHRLPDRLGLTGEQRAATAEALTAIGDESSGEPIRQRLDRLVTVLGDHLPSDPPAAGGWTSQTWTTLRAWLTEGQLSLVDVVDPNGVQIVDGAFGGPPALARLLTGPRPEPGPVEPSGAPAIAPATGSTLDPDRDDEEVAASSMSRRRVTLAVHLKAVRDRATQIAASLGLPEDLVAVVADAAEWHDLGKVEQRFQVMLHGGDSFEAALAAEPLAKSGMDPADRLAGRRARQVSRLPQGARHEAWSAALVEEYLSATGSYSGDADLVLHLVASHHGHARPLLPLVVDSDPRAVETLVAGEKVSVGSELTVSLDHPARFARLNARYGRWGLALLEAVVRCADQTVSGEGS